MVAIVGPKCLLNLISGQYVAINGAASMWARNFTIGQKKNEHLVKYDTISLFYLSNPFYFGDLSIVILGGYKHEHQRPWSSVNHGRGGQVEAGDFMIILRSFASNFFFHRQVICKHLPLDAESLQTGFDLLKSRRAVGKIVFDLTK